jgi:hypothetical protein
MEELLTRRNLIIGVFILLVLFCIRKRCQNNKNDSPKTGLVGRFGEPDEGHGIWSEKQLKGTPFTQIIDHPGTGEYHSKPVPHFDGLETRVSPGIEFIHERLNDLEKIS